MTLLRKLIQSFNWRQQCLLKLVHQVSFQFKYVFDLQLWIWRETGFLLRKKIRSVLFNIQEHSQSWTKSYSQIVISQHCSDAMTRSHYNPSWNPMKMPFRSHSDPIRSHYIDPIKNPVKSHKNAISHAIQLDPSWNPIEIPWKSHKNAISHVIQNSTRSIMKSHRNPSLLNQPRFRGGLSMCASARGLAELMASEAGGPYDGYDVTTSKKGIQYSQWGEWYTYIYI